MKKETAFSKKHIAEVSKRLREYEKVIAADEFVRLDNCDVCETVPLGAPGSKCLGCLFSTKSGTYGCSGRHGVGASCYTKAQQRHQFKHLLKRLAGHGYEFK